jgi:hypothetical protein
MQELDRVLDRDDVQGLGVIEVRDHRGECAALAVARCADDEHQPAVSLGEVRGGRWHAELFERGDDERDGAHDDRERALLAVDVHAEAAHAGRLVRAVVLTQRGDVRADGLVFYQVKRERLGVGGPKWLRAEVDDRAANSRAGRLTDLQVHVTRFGLHCNCTTKLSCA